jgi:hypothetical protein
LIDRRKCSQESLNRNKRTIGESHDAILTMSALTEKV